MACGNVLHGVAAFALAVVAVAVTALPAQAQVCTTTCDEYDQGTCVTERTTCTTPEPPKPDFGAIAYDTATGAWGESYHWENRDKAESVALQNCQDNKGTDCQVMVWFDRNCGAVAVDDDGNAYWALGDGEGAARENAIGKCNAGGSKDCAVQASECSR
jgi:hypothetical protein